MFSLSSLIMRLNTRLNVNLVSNKLQLKCLWKTFSNQKSNYYSILGLKPLSNEDEIKQAYYNLSKQYHPDKNIGNESATSKMLEINEAFEVLGNKDKRDAYNLNMFPKVAARVKKTPFIYEHPEYYDPPELQNRYFRRPVANCTYQQFLKHTKGERKRKRRHLVTKILYASHSGAKYCAKIMK